MTLATFGRWAYLLVAIAAWVGVVFTLVITGVDGYSREAVAGPGCSVELPLAGPASASE